MSDDAKINQVLDVLCDALLAARLGLYDSQTPEEHLERLPPLLKGLLREARAEALRDAADAAWDEWPHTDDVGPWLRDRADREAGR